MSYTGDYTEGLKNKVTGERLFPNVPKTLNMSANLVTTQYGAQFGGKNSSYNWKLLEDHPWTGYTVKIFCYGQQNVTSLETIRDYMKFITGSDYIPRYESNGANDVYICLLAQNISDEDRFWKYQYVEGYGLLAFRVDNFSIRTKESDTYNSARYTINEK